MANRQANNAPNSQNVSQSGPSASAPQPPVLSIPTPPEPASSTSNIPISQPRPGTAPTRMQWYTPGDPNAPVAFRDSKGQIQYLHPRSQRPSSSSTPTSSSSAVLNNVVSSDTNVLPRASTPLASQKRPEGPCSPESADKSRLALDIIRSLGRPKGAFGDPLSPLTPSLVEVIEPSIVKGKRHPTPESSPSTPSKRQRLEHISQFGSTAGEEKQDVVIDLTSSSGDEQPVAQRRPPKSVPELLMATAKVSPSDEVPAGGILETSTTETVPELERAQSITSSEAADVHQVQEDILGTAPGSDASGHSRARTPAEMPLGAVDLVTLQASSSRTPVRTKEKVPLFLPSPSGSPAGPTFSPHTSPPPTEYDTSSAASSSGLRQRVDRKGKGKAREDSDGYSRIDSLSPGRGKPYVLVPPLPRYAKRVRSAGAGSELSDDELARWDSTSLRRDNDVYMLTIDVNDSRRR